MNSALKTARENAGLTQVEVANKAQISERHYIRIEQGERDPRTKTSILIADTLGVTTYEEFKALFGAATPDNAKPPDKSRAKPTET